MMETLAPLVVGFLRPPYSLARSLGSFSGTGWTHQHTQLGQQ